MAGLPVQVLLGLYLGVVTGIVPALVSWALGFSFKYFTGVSIPGFGVIVLALAIAGVNGGLLALTDASIVGNENRVGLVVAILVVLMLSMYAHAKGDAMGGELPRRMSLRSLTERTLSTDVIELVGGRDQVRVTVAGDVHDVEGYPPLPTELRAAIREKELTFPADLPVAELETRVADHLRNEFALADVHVAIDERARATVHAAPPIGALSKRVPAGKRAVSVSTLLPTGLAPGDVVTVTADGDDYRATVLGVRQPGDGGVGSAGTPPANPDAATDGGVDEPTPAPTGSGAGAVPRAAGGDGRVTLAVDRQTAEALLAADVDRFVVASRGTHPEYELTTRLRRSGHRLRRLTVREGGALDGVTLRDGPTDSFAGVAVLAARVAGRWRIAPATSTMPTSGDELFVVGRREALDRFAEAVA